MIQLFVKQYPPNILSLKRRRNYVDAATTALRREVFENALAIHRMFDDGAPSGSSPIYEINHVFIGIPIYTISTDSVSLQIRDSKAPLNPGMMSLVGGTGKPREKVYDTLARESAEELIGFDPGIRAYVPFFADVVLVRNMLVLRHMFGVAATKTPDIRMGEGDGIAHITREALPRNTLVLPSSRTISIAWANFVRGYSYSI